MKEEIESVLYQAVELLNKDVEITESLSNMARTFILQLIATLVLFLLIRFKFWNLITSMIESRKKAIDESLKEKDEAILLRDEARKEVEVLKTDAKKNAMLIIEEAKKTSTIEANEIIDNARKQIIAEEEASHRLIEKERVEMEEGIKKEIIDVAFTMSEKILGREINKDDHKQIVDDAMSILDEEGKK